MAARSTGRGFFRNAFDAIVAARTAEAERYVNDALLRLDDDALWANGFTREALKHRRSGRFSL